MKKWFLDNTRIGQKLSKDAAKQIFGVPNEVIDSIIETELYSIQITFNILPDYKNNNYLVLCFSKTQGDLIFPKSYSSKTTLPPVWNREFGDLDYLDFLVIQAKLNEDLTANEWPKFPIDFSTKNKSHYFLQNPPEDLAERVAKGENYGNIIALKAEARSDLVDGAKEYIKNYHG